MPIYSQCAMSIPFTRSLRSLESDSYRSTLILLLVASPLFLGWLAWFFTGQVALQEVSEQFTQGDAGLIVVTFEQGLPPMMAGGAARLRLSGEDGAPDRLLPGYVHRFVPFADGTTVAHIVLDDPIFFDDDARLTGQAMIEIDTVSPAEFLWGMVDGED